MIFLKTLSVYKFYVKFEKEEIDGLIRLVKAILNARRYTFIHLRRNITITLTRLALECCLTFDGQ